MPRAATIPGLREDAPAEHLGLPCVHPETRDALAAWLAVRHASVPRAWLVSWRRSTGRPQVPYAEAVEELLRVGWIDSTANRLDDERSLLRITPRRPGSPWSRPNKERVARLEAAGLLLPAGRAVVERARADGSWTLLDDVEELVLPDDLAAALAAVPGARAAWDALPPSARKPALLQLVQARRPATRARRVVSVAEAVGRGERPGTWVRPADRPV